MPLDEQQDKRVRRARRFGSTPPPFCACHSNGYSFDARTGWWVHAECGAPTRAWWEGMVRRVRVGIVAGEKSTNYRDDRGSVKLLRRAEGA